MPIGTISYLFLSSARITFCAEFSETSCSADLPPKMTPTLSRLVMSPLTEQLNLQLQFNSELLFHTLLRHVDEGFHITRPGLAVIHKEVRMHPRDFRIAHPRALQPALIDQA